MRAGRERSLWRPTATASSHPRSAAARGRASAATPAGSRPRASGSRSASGVAAGRSGPDARPPCSRPAGASAPPREPMRTVRPASHGTAPGSMTSTWRGPTTTARRISPLPPLRTRNRFTAPARCRAPPPRSRSASAPRRKTMLASSPRRTSQGATRSPAGRRGRRPASRAACCPTRSSERRRASPGSDAANAWLTRHILGPASSRRAAIGRAGTGTSTSWSTRPEVGIAAVSPRTARPSGSRRSVPSVGRSAGRRAPPASASSPGWVSGPRAISLRPSARRRRRARAGRRRPGPATASGVKRRAGSSVSSVGRGPADQPGRSSRARAKRIIRAAA